MALAAGKARPLLLPPGAVEGRLEPLAVEAAADFDLPAAVAVVETGRSPDGLHIREMACVSPIYIQCCV